MSMLYWVILLLVMWFAMGILVIRVKDLVDSGKFLILFHLSGIFGSIACITFYNSIISAIFGYVMLGMSISLLIFGSILYWKVIKRKQKRALFDWHCLYGK